MADRIAQFPCTIPAATPIASPVTIPMQLGIFGLEFVELEVPDGPAGQVGFYIAASGQQAFPFRAGGTPIWMVTNGTLRRWDLTSQANSGDWSLVGYNLGNSPHTIYVTWGLVMVPSGAATQSPIVLPELAASDLTST